MLVKDNIIVEKLTHKTKNISIKIELNFKLNENTVTLQAIYSPDKYKLEQTSLIKYLTELTKSEIFDLENIAARITEDLYDMAVPKKIEVELSEKENDITTSIKTSKSQPKL